MELGGYLQTLRHGLDIVAQCQGLSRDDLVALGAQESFAEELLGLYATYFGPTSFSGRQATARKSRHDVHTLLRIEKHCSRLKERARWRVRAELALTPAADIDRVARRLLKELKPQTGPEAGVRITRRREGNHSLTITDTSLNIADLYSVLTSQDVDPLAAVKEVFFSGGGARAQVHTNVIVPLDHLTTILNSHGDGTSVGASHAGNTSTSDSGAGNGGEDIILQLTNGATMTGAEFVQRALSDAGLVTLVHPYEGPVNLYRTKRFASTKQRLMLMAEHPTCAAEGCNCPAEESQFHHITRWEDGGLTNVDNLVTLCAYHNAVNDDDPAKPTGRGRILRVNGRIAWQPPWNGPPRFADSPAHSPPP